MDKFASTELNKLPSVTEQPNSFSRPKPAKPPSPRWQTQTKPSSKPPRPPMNKQLSKPKLVEDSAKTSPYDVLREPFHSQMEWRDEQSVAIVHYYLYWFLSIQALLLFSIVITASLIYSCSPNPVIEIKPEKRVPPCKPPLPVPPSPRKLPNSPNVSAHDNPPLQMHTSSSSSSLHDVIDVTPTAPSDVTPTVPSDVTPPAPSATPVSQKSHKPLPPPKPSLSPRNDTKSPILSLSSQSQPSSSQSQPG